MEVNDLKNHGPKESTKSSYLCLSFLAIIIFCTIASLGLNPSAVRAQTSSTDRGEKINYTHHKTPVNGFLMHYVDEGKGDSILLIHGPHR